VGARRGGDDYRYYLVLNEEMARAGAHGPGFSVHNDINGQYFRRLMTAEQAQRWMPGCCSGQLITAIAMSEPGLAATCRASGPPRSVTGTISLSTGRRRSSRTGS
jgi:alkylation response protein AidB-like acyl-CoA dehydrogenase